MTQNNKLNAIQEKAVAEVQAAFDSKHSATFRRERLEANRALVQHLSAIVESGADLRFSQILLNYGFVQAYIKQDGLVWVDEFYAEPAEVLKRVQEAYDAFSSR